jgi:hypothetical protein
MGFLIRFILPDFDLFALILFLPQHIEFSQTYDKITFIYIKEGKMKSNKNILIKKKSSEYLKIVDDVIDTIYGEKENEPSKKIAYRSILDDWNPSQVD